MPQPSSGNRDSSRHASVAGMFRPGWVRLLFLGVITGAITGGLVAIFRLAVAAGEARRGQVWARLVTSPGGWIWAALVIAAVAALGGAVTRWVPAAAGGGVAPVAAALTNKGQIRWWSELPAKFVASFFTLVSGLSLGREGPAVFFGGATGQAVGSWFKSDEDQTRHLLACGAAAAVAAAFNAPLAGVLFVWEEFKYSSLQSFFVPALAAVVVATKVAASLVGPGQALALAPDAGLPSQALVLFLLLGLSAGLLGLVYNHGLSYSHKLFNRLPGCPPWLRPSLAALVVAGVAWLMGSDLLGSGQVLITRALAGRDNIAVVAAVLVIKLALTVICAASGASGGVFLPLLSVGALTGCLWGQVATMAFSGLAFSPRFVAAGMAAAFGGILRLPFTGLMLVFELTASYSYDNLLYYLTAVLVAYVVKESGEKLLPKR